jgi:hypothetical protein
MYHFSWMVDYIQEDHGLETIPHTFTGEQHGKGETGNILTNATISTF